MEHDVEQGVVNFQGSVVLDEPEPAELVYERAYSGPCGTKHFGERFLADVGDVGADDA